MVKWRHVVELKRITWTEPITQKYILLNKLQLKIRSTSYSRQPTTIHEINIMLMVGIKPEIKLRYHLCKCIS